MLTLQPWLKWDPRSRSYRALAFRYHELLEALAREGIPCEDRVLRPLPFPQGRLELPYDELRPYQQEALTRWLKDGGARGVVVLPTGAGKTHVALGAIARLKCAAFVVVPTLDLVEQWKRLLARFNLPIGELTGKEKRLEPITVATYDSAYIHADRIGNRFPLIVFDEVHHLPSPGYRHIAEFFASPYRLGLTATYERPDMLHEALSELLGGLIFEIHAEELKGTYLAHYTLERIYIELTPEEQEAYSQAQKLFQGYLKRHRLYIRDPRDFERLIYRSGSDPEAWKAVRARHRAVQIAFNAEGKLKELGRLLERHGGDRILIFTRFNELVYRISEQFLIPCITHKTERAERAEILEGFRRGIYEAIASSQVLDEGVDVPEANVGILLSGTGSPREFIQRLGRLLRPKEGKRAVLYELIARGTGEEQTSSRRRRKLKGRRGG
jgi:superfamily II DNA or RNA helicase